MMVYRKHRIQGGYAVRLKKARPRNSNVLVELPSYTA